MCLFAEQTHTGSQRSDTVVTSNHKYFLQVTADQKLQTGLKLRDKLKTKRLTDEQI